MNRADFAGVILFFAFLASAWAGEPFVFELTPSLPITPGETAAMLSATVAEGYILYEKKLKVSFSQGKVTADFPIPHQKDDPFGPGKIDVYGPGQHLIGLQIIWNDSPNGMATVSVDYQGCSSQTCFMPSKKEFSLVAPQGVVSFWAASGSAGIAAPRKILTSPEPPEGQARQESIFVSTPSGPTDFGRSIREQGLLWVLMVAFLSGVLVSLTPCVYPMIPITLSIIGSRSENISIRRGFLLSVTYVAGLSLTYALLGLMVAIFGAHIRGFIQGAVFQTLIAGVFVVLALSMFDVFMLQTPDFLRQRLTGIRGSGISGVFLIGMISGLMASPCVAAPLAGILAFIASTGSAFLGFLLLLAFSWGMGLILIVIGTFSGTLNSLPRAGEWMNRVKEFYGFLLLGAALFFIKPLLGKAVLNFLMALFLGSIAAFLGLFTPLNPEDDRFAPKVLKAWSILVLLIAGAFAVTAAAEWGGLGLPPTVGERQSLAKPAGLVWFEDLTKALDQARERQAPVFVDFRADWCAICRELEERVFPDPVIHSLLEKVVTVRIDATTNTPAVDELLKKFRVVGLPTLIVLDQKGRESADLRVVGDIDATALGKVLQKALQTIKQ